MTDMTADARIRQAEQVVREQRDPSGEHGAIGNPTEGPRPLRVVEAFYVREIERLQRAVMGEDAPKSV